MEKKELRKNMKNEISKLTEDFIKSESKQIYEIFINSEIYKNCNCVFSYCAMKNEISVNLINEKILKDGKKLLIPKCEENGIMNFYNLKNDLLISEQIHEGMFGIYEPNENLEIFSENTFYKNEDFYKNHKTCVLVPGLAFSKNGARLGKGKGFCDRYLSRLLKMKMDPVKVGVHLSCQLVNEVPFESHDLFMDYLLGSNGIISGCPENNI